MHDQRQLKQAATSALEPTLYGDRDEAGRSRLESILCCGEVDKAECDGVKTIAI